ncbi:hypothetical protein TCSYLVIO_002222, partial [Trypanosoma cruzi]
RAPKIVRGVLSQKWLIKFHFIATLSFPGNNSMLGKRSTIVVVGYPNNVTDAAQSINNGISRKRERCRRFPMHGRRHGLQIDKRTQILVIMESYIAFVLCERKRPECLPEREKIDFQLDRCIFRWCTNAKVCFTTVAVQCFHIMEVSGDKAWNKCIAIIQLHTMTVSNRKGLHGVMGRTSPCDRSQLVRAWHGLLCGGGSVRNQRS